MSNNLINYHQCPICHQKWVGTNVFLWHLKQHGEDTTSSIAQSTPLPVEETSYVAQAAALPAPEDPSSKPLEKLSTMVTSIKEEKGKADCNICGKNMWKYNLARHASRAHSKAMKFFCIFCNKTFFGEPKFLKAGNSKVLSYTCSRCRYTHVTYIFHELIGIVQNEKQVAAKNAIEIFKKKTEISFKPYLL